jgi:hypothetical protein
MNVYRWSRIALLLALVGGAAACGSGTDEAPSSSEDQVATNDLGKILDPIAAGTAWADLPHGTQKKIRAIANKQLKKYDAKWSLDQLEAHLVDFRDFPTPLMNAAFDKYVLNQFPTIVTDTTFQASVGLSLDIEHVLRSLYIVRLSALRHNPLQTKDLLDWDGANPIGEFALPAAGAIGDYKKLASKALAAARDVDRDSLAPMEQQLLDRAIIHLRQHATGSTGFSEGGDDLLTLWGRADIAYDLPAFGGPNGAMPDAETYLRYVAAYFEAPVKYVDVGTVVNAEWLLSLGANDPAMVEQHLGAGTTLAKNFLLLSSWFLERVKSSNDADTSCSIYSKSKRDKMWESFTADNLFNSDGAVSFEAGRQQLDAWADSYLETAKAAAKAAVGAFSAEGGLTTAQRDAVFDAIDAETRLGALVDTAKAAMDEVTGSTTASVALQAKLDAIPSVGEYLDAQTPIADADRQLVEGAWAAVKAFLLERYGISSVTDQLVIDGGAAAFTDHDGSVHIGMQYLSGWNEMNIFSVLLHEAHHSVNFLSGWVVEGPAWEGAANLTANLTLPKFLEWEFARRGTPELAGYYQLAGTAVSSARLVAKTKATVDILFRGSCGKTDTIEFAHQIATEHGVTDAAGLDNVSLRAHQGIAYLKYSIGEITYGQLLADVGAAVGHPVEPYNLSACGHPTPTLDAATIAELASCPYIDK